MRAVFRQGWPLVQVYNQEFNSELSSMPLFLFQWFWLINWKATTWSCQVWVGLLRTFILVSCSWQRRHTHRCFHLGIYTIKISCQNKWSDWEAAMCASCTVPVYMNWGCFECRVGCAEILTVIHTWVLLLYKLTDVLATFFIDSNSEEWLFFSALIHVGLENKFCSMLWSRRKVLLYPCQYWEIHNVYFWRRWSDWGILFCFTFVCRLESVVQQFDWLMQLLFDMHPNILFYCTCVIIHKSLKP